MTTFNRFQEVAQMQLLKAHTKLTMWTRNFFFSQGSYSFELLKTFSMTFQDLFHDLSEFSLT